MISLPTQGRARTGGNGGLIVRNAPRRRRRGSRFTLASARRSRRWPRRCHWPTHAAGSGQGTAGDVGRGALLPTGPGSGQRCRCSEDSLDRACGAGDRPPLPPCPARPHRARPRTAANDRSRARSRGERLHMMLARHRVIIGVTRLLNRAFAATLGAQPSDVEVRLVVVAGRPEVRLAAQRPALVMPPAGCPGRDHPRGAALAECRRPTSDRPAAS